MPLSWLPLPGGARGVVGVWGWSPRAGLHRPCLHVTPHGGHKLQFAPSCLHQTWLGAAQGINSLHAQHHCAQVVATGNTPGMPYKQLQGMRAGGWRGRLLCPTSLWLDMAVRLHSGQWDLTGNGYTIQFVFKGNLVDIVMLAK